MASAIGWYGPLVDLCRAASHLGDFVQLLVFVHRCTPVQYKLSKGGEILRTDIQVGDDTLPFFSVSLWQKQMGTMAVAGDVILLQNVKITKFGQVVEAKTVQCSSLLRLVHSESLLARGVDELILESRVGKTTIEKLRKVIVWTQRVTSALYTAGPYGFKKRLLSRNWKVPKESESQNFFSLSDVLHLKNSCKAIFNASVGEIFLPITWRTLGDSEKEKMFVRRRITQVEDNSVAKDFICIGCQLCGSPLDPENGSTYKQNSFSLYCPKSSNHLHSVTLIYRPFMLYVWDESEYLPLFVRNKAAELLFGNIRAERVYTCYSGQRHHHNPDQTYLPRKNVPEAAGKRPVGSCSLDADKSLEVKEKNNADKNIDFHLIWLILLKMLLQQGKNSPLKFEATVSSSLDAENGKFEMLSMSIPYIRTKQYSS